MERHRLHGRAGESSRAASRRATVEDLQARWKGRGVVRVEADLQGWIVGLYPYGWPIRASREFEAATLPEAVAAADRWLDQLPDTQGGR